MINICKESITILLKIIFEEPLKNDVFPEIWKEPNVVPVHKTEHKRIVKHYRPISLIPNFGKVFEKVIYNSLFNFFISNKLFITFQLDIIPEYSCIAQLLLIVHTIQTAFHENPTADVRSILFRYY